MHIAFTPMRRDDRLSLSRRGDILTVNGEVFDFSAIPEGASLPRAAVACDWLASDVERRGGALYLTLILPHGAEAGAAALFPEPVTAADGPVALPGATPEASA